MEDDLTKKIDELDRQIITILREDSRTKYTDIGKQLGKRDTAIHLRVKKMMERGLIKKFTIQTDFGFSLSFFISLKVQKSLYQEIEMLISDLKIREYVHNIIILNGKEEILMLILAENKKQINELFRDLNNHKGIKSIKIQKIDNVIKQYQ